MGSLSMPRVAVSSWTGLASASAKAIFRYYEKKFIARYYLTGWYAFGLQKRTIALFYYLLSEFFFHNACRVLVVKGQIAAASLWSR
jgi:hypothetical protein